MKDRSIATPDDVAPEPVHTDLNTEAELYGVDIVVTTRKPGA